MKVTVVYWIGTTKMKDYATTYQEALEIAGRNQNAWGPRFYDDKGVQLYDDGQGLAYEEEENGMRVYAV